MKFVLDSSVIGTQKHLLHEDGKLQWASDVPIDFWHVTNGVPIGKCFADLAKLSLNDVSLLPQKQYVDAMKLVMGNISNVPWQKAMPKDAHATFVKSLLNDVVGILNVAPVKYYDETWVHASRLFSNLQRAKINKRLLNDLIDEGKGNVSALRSFIPADGEFAALVKYNRFATVTGRLTVESGPHILELKREHRQIIESVHGDNGEIAIIDFNALEPRVVLYEANKACSSSDLYSHVAKSHGLTRTEAKAATICELYGIGLSQLAATLECNEEHALEIARAIRKFYEVRQLTRRVKDEFIRNGIIRTRFGRLIKCDDPKDGAVLNHFVQGTACDVALLAFAEITEEMKQRTPSSRPLFTIHDALVIDALKSELPMLDEMLSVRVNGYVQRFHLKRTLI